MKVEIDLDKDELDWIIDDMKEDLDYNETKYQLNEDERFIWGLNIEAITEIIRKLQQVRDNMPLI